jgi:hypothetical protein
MRVCVCACARMCDERSYTAKKNDDPHGEIFLEMFVLPKTTVQDYH